MMGASLAWEGRLRIRPGGIGRQIQAELQSERQIALHYCKRVNALNEKSLLERITINPEIFGGKPIIRGRRLAVEHVLGQLAAGDDFETLLEGYPWLEREDILACLAYAQRLVGHERVEPLVLDKAA
jgi:uncharacterized protein (DUF433 family)